MSEATVETELVRLRSWRIRPMPYEPLIRGGVDSGPETGPPSPATSTVAAA